MRRSMRLLSMAARAMLSICGDWQPAPAQRPWFCFALMARRWLRVGRPRGGVCSHGRAFYGSLDKSRGQRVEALAFGQQDLVLWHEARKLLARSSIGFLHFLTHPSYSTGGRDPATAGRAEGRSKFPAVDPCKVRVIRARAASAKLLNNTIFSAPVVRWSK